MDELWGQYVSLIFPTKTLVGKIENMTHAYVNITSLKTFIRNLVSKTYQRKEYNMMLVQVNITNLMYKFWNIGVGKDLVNRPVRFSHDLIYKMFTSAFMGGKTT